MNANLKNLKSVVDMINRNFPEGKYVLTIEKDNKCALYRNGGKTMVYSARSKNELYESMINYNWGMVDYIRMTRGIDVREKTLGCKFPD